MRSFKYLTYLWLLLVPLWVSVTTATAQPATCETVVEDALAVAGESCSELAHNTACYGHTRVQAAFRETDAEVIFGSPADQVDVALVEQIQTAPYDEASGEWGVAVMNVQAEVPDTLPGQGVIFLLLGEAQVLDGAAGRVDRDPMQAFYFSGGIGPAACQDAPNTLAIRSPENLTVNLTVNGMDITLGSTITLTNSTANTLTITVHDGQMRIPAAGVTVNANQSVDVALNAVSVASTISSPRPATADELSVAGTVNAAYDALDGTAPPAATTTYTVQPGDTLFSIARNNGTCVSELMQANNIPESQINTIFVGQVLTIPDGSTCTGGVMDVRPVATTAPPAQTEEATQDVTQEATADITPDVTRDVTPEVTDDVTGQFNDQFGTPEPLVTEDSPVQQAP